MYDDGNGAVEPEKLDQEGHYNVVQTDNANTLSTIDQHNMNAMGVLYSAQSMKDHFSCSPNDSRICFWALYDESDRGPSGEGNPPVLMKDIYNENYTRKLTTTKPLSINISQAVVFEEYARGCDVLITDPYVLNTVDSNTKRITERMEEAKDVASGINSNKRIIVVLWAWAPPYRERIISSPALYATEHALIKADTGIHGIATFKWSQRREEIIVTLDDSD